MSSPKHSQPLMGFVELDPFYMHASDLSVGWVEPFDPEPFGAELTVEGLMAMSSSKGSSKGKAKPIMHGLCRKLRNG